MEKTLSRTSISLSHILWVMIYALMIYLPLPLLRICLYREVWQIFNCTVPSLQPLITAAAVIRAILTVLCAANMVLWLAVLLRYVISHDGKALALLKTFIGLISALAVFGILSSLLSHLTVTFPFTIDPSTPVTLMVQASLSDIFSLAGIIAMTVYIPIGIFRTVKTRTAPR